MIGQVSDRGELEPVQRDMRGVEIDGGDRGGTGEQVVEHVAAARRDRHQPALRRQRQRLEIDGGIFPDLIVDEVPEPAREEPVEQAAGRVAALEHGVGDQPGSHSFTLAW